MTQDATLQRQYEMTDHSTRNYDPYTWGKYRITLKWLNRFVPEWKNGKILNVGCGAGDFSALLLKDGAMPANLVSCEPDSETYNFAKANLKTFPDTRVLNQSLNEIELPDSSIDLIVMHDVLEHIEDDLEAVRLLKRLLHSNGSLLLSVPTHQWLFGRHDEELLHFRRYSVANLCALLESEFKLVKVRNYGFLFIPITLVMSKWLRIPYPKSSTKMDWKYWCARTLSWFEERFAFPTGNSVIILARPKP